MDGRDRSALRPFSLEYDVIPSSHGSVRIRMDKTDVIVVVKAELGQPDADEGENLGIVNINVDCSTNMTGQFERGEGERLSVSLTSLLETVLIKSGAFPRHKLCIVAGKICWILNIDVLVNSSSGNLLDVIALGVKAVLRATVIPHITVTRKAVDSEGGSSTKNDDLHIEVSNDPNQSHTLSDWDKLIPYVVSICRIGNRLIADPTLQEEMCVQSKLAMAFNDSSRLLGTFKLGSGAFSVDNIGECLAMGNEVSRVLANMFDEAFFIAVNGLTADEDDEMQIL